MSEEQKKHEQAPVTVTGTSPKPGVLSLSIKEKGALYAAYMPFLKGGGLFIPTNRTYNLGEEVFILLSFLYYPLYSRAGAIFSRPRETPMYSLDLPSTQPDCQK